MEYFQDEPVTHLEVSQVWEKLNRNYQRKKGVRYTY
jgi:hypothetical protein